MSWTFAAELTFDNQVAELRLDGRDAHLRIEKTEPEDWQAPKLRESLSMTILPRRAPASRHEMEGVTGPVRDCIVRCHYRRTRCPPC